jgi:hypothetical protein
MARADLKLAAALIGSPLQAFAARLQCAAIAPVDEKWRRGLEFEPTVRTVLTAFEF